MTKSTLKLRENIPISQLTTMRLGGNARWVAEASNQDHIRAAYKFAHEQNLPVFILGGGSNLIGRDEGFEGLIIQNKTTGIEIIAETDQTATIRGASGEVLDNFIEFCTDRQLSCIEAMSGIPGTLGATPVQNVGAYGQEISDVLESVEVYDSAQDAFISLEVSELQMGYRSTVFNDPKKTQALLQKIDKRANIDPTTTNSADFVNWLTVNKAGEINLNVLKSTLKKAKPSLVSVMLANNETGTTQDVKQIIW